MHETMRRMLKERPLRTYLDRVRGQGELYAPLDSIPPEVRVIFVTREDPGFYGHKGALPKNMLKAFKYAVRTRRPMPGGSTITQQLMKNIYLSCDRSVLRKAKEIALALMVERRALLTKDEILELYLNCVRYGPDVYGIADAAEFYFGKTADALTRNQAVILATTAISPYWRRPAEDPKAFAKHRNDSLYELVAFRAMGPGEARTLAHIYNPVTGLDPELRRLTDIYGVAGPKTGDGLAAYAEAQEGCPYWRGGYGQTATLGLLNHRRWDDPGEFEGTACLDDLGKRVFDDAGLIKGYLWSGDTCARPYHDRDNDWSCAMIYERAEEKGGMDSFDRGNGRILYTGMTPGSIDHAGVYSSDGFVYHAKDCRHGVVKEAFSPENWTFWSGLPAYENHILSAGPHDGQPAGYQPVPRGYGSRKSPLASYTALSPNHSGPREHPVTRITPHYAAGDPSVEVLGFVFADGEREASANYGIGSDGRVAVYVEEGNRSWASGSPENDDRAVTIECANLPDGSLTDACWDSLVDLCADICRRNGITDCSYTGDTDGVLTMHRWFQPTECPGPWLSEQFERLSREVNAKLDLPDPAAGD